MNVMGSALERSAGSKLATAQRNLDDAVGLSLGKSLEGAVDNLDGGHVNGGIGVALFLSRVEHLDVLFLCRYRHGTCFVGWNYQEHAGCVLCTRVF